MPLPHGNQRIAAELDLNRDDVRSMTRQLREGLIKKTPVSLSGEIECDEVYVTAVHKEHPGAVFKSLSTGGRSTLSTEKPPVFGMIQRDGKVVIQMLENVKQAQFSPSCRRSLYQVRWFTQMNTRFTADFLCRGLWTQNG